ncbi:MAG: hypothetical protein ACE145_20975 [Terriglobia bacterium]
MSKRCSSSKLSSHHSTRREFLKGASVVAAGFVSLPAALPAELKPLPTIELGGKNVTRLIAGGNPLYGYSHFNGILDKLMVEYFTDEQLIRFLLDCQKAGINSWQSNFKERTRKQYPKIRAAGVTMHWLSLCDPWDANPRAKTPEEIHDAMMKCVDIAAPAKPVGMAHHGVGTDRLYRAGRLDLIKDFINKVHDLGLPAGISTHNPAVVEAVEEKGWNNDYYMNCFYRITREQEEFRKEIGVEPVGETYLSSDPPRMCKMIQQTKKTCLGFKILAAGRKCDSPAQLREAFKFAFANIKPGDATIVGMFPKFSDQITENANIVREIAA